MALTLDYDSGTGLLALHIKGILKRAEFAESERIIAEMIDGGVSPRILALFQNFGGWEKGEDWNNLEFMFSYGTKIGKIAMVGAGTKEDEVKAFSGAGLRPTPVRFFAADETDTARAWLLED